MGCQNTSHILKPVSTVEETSVKFPDVNLANEVRKALDLPKGAEITKSKLATLTILQISTQNKPTEAEQIYDLTGLEHATQLNTLRIRNNKINDVSLLSHLKQLDNLELSGMEISDISPLSDLTQLRYLYLRDNRIR